MTVLLPQGEGDEAGDHGAGGEEARLDGPFVEDAGAGEGADEDAEFAGGAM